MKMTDKGKVMAGKISAVVVGCIAIYLGIVFEGMHVSFLVAIPNSSTFSATIISARIRKRIKSVSLKKTANVLPCAATSPALISAG